MAVFGVKLSNYSRADSVVVKKFFKAVNFRLHLKDFLHNPFINSSVVEVDSDFFLVCMIPIYPAFYKYVIIITFLVLLVFGWNPFLLIGFVIGLSGFFYSRFYYFLMLRRGLRKSNYKGRILLVL